MNNLHLVSKSQSLENQKYEIQRKRSYAIETVKQNFNEMNANNSKSSPNVETIPVTFEDDIWLIILKCHQSQDPPGTLLKASRTLKSPILALLATFYEVRNQIFTLNSYSFVFLVCTLF